MFDAERHDPHHGNVLLCADFSVAQEHLQERWPSQLKTRPGSHVWRLECAAGDVGIALFAAFATPFMTPSATIVVMMKRSIAASHERDPSRDGFVLGPRQQSGCDGSHKKARSGIVAANSRSPNQAMPLPVMTRPITKAIAVSGTPASTESVVHCADWSG